MPDSSIPEDLPDYPWRATTRRLKKIALIILIGFIAMGVMAAGILAGGLPDVTALKTVNPTTTALMEQRIKVAHEAGQKLTIRQKWVAFKAMPHLLKQTVRVTEDAGFYQHAGIDLGEIRAAVRKSWRQKKPLRGASTITQQLAKNLYLSPKRSIWRKIKEYVIAHRLEAALSKDRIFHLYLNIIELGPGIFGVEAGSQYYFGKPVERLNLEEIVRLTAIIPRPLKADPRKSSQWVSWRARWILDTLKRYGYINSFDHQMTRRLFG